MPWKVTTTNDVVITYEEFAAVQIELNSWCDWHSKTDIKVEYIKHPPTPEEKLKEVEQALRKICEALTSTQ